MKRYGVPLNYISTRSILICALLFTTFACTTKDSHRPVVRLAYLQNDLHHLPAFVALEKGLYHQEGLTVKVAGIFRAGPELMSAFASGSIDVGYVGLAPATVAVANKTASVKIVAQVNQNGSALIVRKDVSIPTLPALAGKIIAIPGHATIQDFLLRMAFSREGIDPSCCTVITIKPPEMGGLLTRSQIDAFIAWEPYPSLATQERGTVLLSSKEIWPDHPCCVLVASTSFIREHPAQVSALYAAHLASLTYIEHHHAEAIRIGMQYTAMEQAPIERALENIQFNHHLNLQHLHDYVIFLNRLGYTAITNTHQFTNSLVLGKE